MSDTQNEPLPGEKAIKVKKAGPILLGADRYDIFEKGQKAIREFVEELFRFLIDFPGMMYLVFILTRHIPKRGRTYADLGLTRDRDSPAGYLYMKKCPEGTKKIHHAMDKEFRAPMEIRRIYHAQWKPASSPAEFKVTWQYDDKYGPTEELKLKSLNRLRMMRNRQTREASSIGKAPGTSAETAIDVGLTKESNFKQPGASRYEV